MSKYDEFKGKLIEVFPSSCGVKNGMRLASVSSVRLTVISRGVRFFHLYNHE